MAISPLSCILLMSLSQPASQPKVSLYHPSMVQTMCSEGEGLALTLFIHVFGKLLNPFQFIRHTCQVHPQSYMLSQDGCQIQTNCSHYCLANLVTSLLPHTQLVPLQCFLPAQSLLAMPQPYHLDTCSCSLL